jgi:thimet oligopeptidase
MQVEQLCSTVSLRDLHRREPLAEQFFHLWDESNGNDAANVEIWVEARLQAKKQAIDRLLSVEGKRTIENTLRPFDEAQTELYSAGSQTSLLHSVHSNKEVRDKTEILSQKISQVSTELSLNQSVYRALQALDLHDADDATKHYVERTLLQYRLAGVDKDDATRQRIRELHDQATKLSLEFGRSVQECVHHVTVKHITELEGLPTDYIANHPPSEDGVVTLTTDPPDMLPVMTYASNHDLRLRMFLAYNTRAYPENRQVLLQLLQTRQEIAKILGFKTWADLATADQMMGSADAMKKLFQELETTSREGANHEYEMVLAFAKKQEPGLKEIDAASRGYWYEQYRRTAFDFDSQSVRPYFPYASVEKGILDTASKLFLVEFRKAQNAAVWHPSVSAWDVFDNGRQIGRFYLDMHPRTGKSKWFSAFPLVSGIRGTQLPEAALICNFPGGEIDDPGLMQYSDVVTYFHEFGHLMHAILGGQVRWTGTNAFSIEGDFVEVPSQMLEEFFRNAKLLQSFARHYQTGEPLPAETISKMNRASGFGRADWVRSQLFYSTYSLNTHSLPATEINLDKLFEEDYKRLLPYAWVEGNRMYSSFTHLTGYSSNYYTYLLDKVIALDFFNQFDPESLLQGPTAMRYRRTVLEPGATKPAHQLVKDFLGREHSMMALRNWMNQEFGQN